jgi:YHS domain-containing protein
MLKQLVFIFTFALFLSASAFAQENPKSEKEEAKLNSVVQSEQSSEMTVDSTATKIWNKVCPVKGNPVEDESPTVEYNGKLYGFCCPGCDTKFAKNPEKYAKNLSEDGTKFIGKK